MEAAFASAIGGMWFLASAWSKWRDPGTFSEIVASYPLPGPLRSVSVTRAVPVFESVAGLALLSLRPEPVAWGASIALLFLLGASAIVAIRWSRGERRFRCGCGGNLNESRPAAEVLVRNTVLAGLLGFSAWNSTALKYAIEAAGPAWLTGCGAVIGARLAGAARSAWENSREWKALG